MVLIAAKGMLPDRVVKSKIVSPSFEKVLIMYSQRSTGFSVGCIGYVGHLKVITSSGNLSVFPPPEIPFLTEP